MTTSLLSREAIRYVTIAASSSESPRNDTANVVELGDSSLIVVWHKYRASDDHGSDFGKADIALKRSRDGGLSWVEERIIVPREAGDLNVQAPALIRLPGGELLLGALRAHAKDSSSLELYRSRDDGETWTRAGGLWSRSSGQWLQGGATGFLLLSGGRIVFPFHGGTGGQWEQHNVVRCFLSDDDGATWRMADGSVDMPMRGAMEASLAESEPGRLLMSLRTQLGTVMLSESRDGCETWSPMWSSGLTAPESCTCLRAISGTKGLALIWNGCRFYEPAHHHFGERTPLSVAVSADGLTWRRVGDVETDPCCDFTNLNCTFLSNGDAVLTYFVLSPSFALKADRADLRAAVIPRSEWVRVVKF